MADILDFDQGIVYGGNNWYKHVGIDAMGYIAAVDAAPVESMTPPKCVEFYCPARDNREQLLSPWTLSEGEQAWFSWLMHIPSTGFNLPSTGWQVLAQWHQNGIPSQPPVAILAYGTGRYGMEAIGTDGTTNTRRKLDLGEINYGVTERWAVFVYRKRDQKAGRVVIYREGRTSQSSLGATSYDTGSAFPVRFEVGLYGTSTYPRSIYMDDFRRGATLADVTPDTPAPPPPPTVDPCADLRVALQDASDVNNALRNANNKLIVERDAAVAKLGQAKTYLASL